MALGAQRSDVLLLVLKNAGFLVGAGLLAGLACTWIVARAVRSFLFGVSVHDPATIAAASALLMVCGLLAAFMPARRAASADPAQALRME
jgi:ABC-type antimicrobial peptide transport system permease subunit